MNLSLLNWLEVQRLFWHSHWIDIAKLGAVIPPTGSPGGQSICPRRGGSAFPWGQSTSVQWYPRHTYSAAPSASPLIFFFHGAWWTAAVVSELLLDVFSSDNRLQETRLLFQPLCLEKNALENSWQESEAFVEFDHLASEPLSPHPGELPLCALTSVWVALLTCAGVTESLSFSTPSSALCPPVSESLISLERTFAAGRTRRDWSCPRVHSRSWACCWGHGYGVPEHAPCRCQASSPLFWTGWWSSWSVLSSCWCQCCQDKQGKRTLMPCPVFLSNLIWHTALVFDVPSCESTTHNFLVGNAFFLTWNVALSCLWHRPLWQTGCCLKSSMQQGLNPFLISAAGH